MREVARHAQLRQGAVGDNDDACLRCGELRALRVEDIDLGPA